MPISTASALKVAQDILGPLGHATPLAITLAASLIVRAVEISEREQSERTKEAA